MRGRLFADRRHAIIGAGVAFLFGLMFFALLMVIEEPAEVSKGIARENGRMQRIEALLRQPVERDADPPGAICHGDGTTAAAEMQRTLEARATDAGLTLVGLSVAPGMPDSSTLGLYPVAVQFEGSGSYVGVLGLLRNLSTAQPEVFLNTVELRTRTTEVDLKLNGRFFCSTSALL